MGVLLSDDFERTDTLDGSLESAATGQAWDLRGAVDGNYPPFPVLSFGKITSGNFVVTGGQIVFAFALLARKPRQLTIDWFWLDKGSGTQFTTLAIIITNDPANDWIKRMLHITVTNGTCKIQKRLGNGANPNNFIDMNMGAQTISPSLGLQARLIGCSSISLEPRLGLGSMTTSTTAWWTTRISRAS